MKNIFFDPTYHNITQTLISLLAFIFLTGLLIYIIYIVTGKLMYQKSLQRKELSLRLCHLWSVVIYFLLFNVYLGLLFYFVGIDFIRPSKLYFYLGLLSQIVIYIGVIVYFFINRKSLNRTIHNPSIN